MGYTEMFQLQEGPRQVVYHHTETKNVLVDNTGIKQFVDHTIIKEGLDCTGPDSC